MALTTPQLGLFQAGLGAVQAGMGIWGMQRLQREADRAIDAIPQYKGSQEISNIYQSAKMRSQTGLSGSAKKLATSGLESAAMTAYKQAKDLRSGQGLVGTGEEMRQKGALQLAKMEEDARVRNEAALTQTATLEAGEKQKEYQSAKEKAELKANAAAQKVAAKKQMLAQGLAGMTAGATTAASGSKSSNVLQALKALGITG